MNQIEKNWILEKLRPFQLNAEVSPIQRNICFIGGTLGEIAGSITGGTESAVDELDEGALLDNLGGVLDDAGITTIVDDVLEDGTPDETFNELVDDILDPVGLGGDPTTPQVTYSKTGQLTRLRKFSPFRSFMAQGKSEGLKFIKN